MSTSMSESKLGKSFGNDTERDGSWCLGNLFAYGKVPAIWVKIVIEILT